MLPEISVILPCYRAAGLAVRSTERLAAFLDRAGRSWEVIVVDDGGGDFTDAAWPADERIRLVRLPRNVGKGGAVAAGMRAARGRARLYTDVDLPYDLELIPVVADYLLERRYHVVIGDRTLPTSSYAMELGPARRVASAVFTTIVGRLVTGGFFDTQCGLKGVRGDVADALFPMIRVRRFAFDVELVYVGLIHRLDIKRIPVRLRANETSSVRLLRDSSRMLADVARLPWRRFRGAYASAELDAIVLADFDAVRDGGGMGRAAAPAMSRGTGAYLGGESDAAPW